MLLNLSQTFAPLCGLSFTKEELYAKIQDVTDQQKDILPRNLNFGDKIFEALRELKLIRPFKDKTFLYLPDDITIDISDEFKLKVEYLILDYSFNLGLKIDICSDEQTYGSYVKSDININDTFSLFHRDHVWYAAYCPGEEQVRIMEMPSCKDLNFTYVGEPGFIVHSIWIPDDQSLTLPWHKFQGNFGFIAGHYQGDDSSLKLQYLDMVEFGQRKIVREDRFGYLELPNNVKLKDAIDLSYFDPLDSNNDRIYVAQRKVFSTGRNIGKREKTKNLQILRWVCQNRTCHGQGDFVVNPAEVDQPILRCTKCLEVLHNVNGNFTLFYLDEK